MSTQKNVTTFSKKVTVSDTKYLAETEAFSNIKTAPRLMILPKQKSKKDGKCMIYLEIAVLEIMAKSTVRKFKRIPTNIRVLPEDWSQIKQAVKPRNIDHQSINRKLETVLESSKEYSRGKIEDAPYLQSLPSEIKTIDKYLNKKKRKNMLEFLDDYIIYRKSNSVRNTYKEFTTLKNRLLNFIEAKNLNQPLYFEDMTFQLAERYKKYCKEVKYNPNTVDKTFESLCNFLNYYYDDQNSLGFYLPEDFRRPKFKKIQGTHNPEPSPLYQDEILKLIKHKAIKSLPIEDENGNQMIDKSSGKKLWVSVEGQKKIIQLFLLGCFTGLRFSDILRLTSGNFQDGYIVIRANKTDKKGTKTLRIPIFSQTKDILESINFDLSQISLTNQIANRYLKTILKTVGINTIMKEYYYDLEGNRTEADKFKYEIVTFHSSRDTFITNCLIAGIDIMTVMSWSGHTQFDTFKKYVALSDAYLKVNKVKADKFFIELKQKRIER